jgi:(2Fe-2S) ferredoxin
MASTPAGKEYIMVGMGSCGIAAGAEEVFAALVEEAKKRNIQIDIRKCGCLGMCFAEPLVEVKVEGLPSVMYGKVNKEIAVKIIEKHVVSKMLVNDCIFDFTAKKPE